MMFPVLLFLLLVVVPLVEIYLLIRIGHLIGAIPTIVCIIATAALGALLLRIQGLYALHALRTNLKQGSFPAVEIIAGLLLLIVAALLLTPGFVTDAFGFLLLIPALRHALAEQLLHLLLQHGRSATGQVVIEGDFYEREKAIGEQKTDQD